MKKFYVCAVVAVFLATGCIPISIQPLYTEKDTVYLPELIGTWQSSSDVVFTFESDNQKGYHVIAKDAEESHDLSVHLVRVKNHTFMDVIATGDDSNCKDTTFHIPVHILLQAEITADSFKYRAFDSDWLKNRWGSGKLRIPYAPMDNWFVFTAKPKQLQRFMNQWVDEPGAYADWQVLSRKSP